MTPKRRFARLGVVLMIASAALAGPSGVALAAPPANDNFGSAISISALPFNTSQSTREATLEQGESRPCGFIDRTVWYRFTPNSTVTVEANTFGSNFNTVLAAYSGGSLDTLAPVGCSDDDPPWQRQSRIRFNASASQTYYFQIGGYLGSSGNLVFGMGAVAPPANDNFGEATLIPELPFTITQSTTGASLETEEPTLTCAAVDRTVWYRFTPSSELRVEADTFGSDFDTVLAVYTGNSPGNLTSVACNDDTTEGVQSRLRFNASTDQTYHFQVGGSHGASGNLALTVKVIPPPTNDNFVDAAPIAGFPFTDRRYTRRATLEPGEPMPSCAQVGKTIWYRFTPTSTVTVQADTFESDFDTVLAVYTGISLDGLTPVVCNDDASLKRQSWVRFSAVAGQTYHFQVGGYESALGPSFGDLTFRMRGFTPPANDYFAGATPVSGLPFTATQSTSAATLEQGESRPCGLIDQTIWYSFTPTSTVTVEADTFESDFDTVLAVYTGSSLDGLAPVVCNDDASFTPQSWIRFSAIPGQTYHFQVGGHEGASGNLVLRVQGFVPEANDNFSGAILVAAPPFTASQSTIAATLEPGEPRSCGYIDRTHWYRFTPTTTVTVEADTFGSSFNTVLAVYSGGSLGSLAPIVCNDDTGAGRQSWVRFSAVAGKSYYFQVGGFAGASGEVAFRLQGFAPPANDYFGSATSIPSLPFSDSTNTDAANIEAGEPGPCGFAQGYFDKTVWYRFTSTTTITVEADTFGSDFDTVLAAYTGTALDTLSPVACNDQAAGGNQSRIQFRASTGKTYYFQVAGFGAASGSLTFKVQAIPSPPNDNLIDATPILGLPFAVTQTTLAATLEPGESQPFCTIPLTEVGATVWYRFTPASTLLVEVDTLGSDFNTVLAAYAITSTGILVPLACDDNGAGDLHSKIRFGASGGQIYYLQIGGYRGAFGTMRLSVLSAQP